MSNLQKFLVIRSKDDREADEVAGNCSNSSGHLVEEEKSAESH